MPQLGYFTEDINQEGDRQTRDREGQSVHRGKFPTVIPFSQLISTMDSTNPDRFESLLPLIEKMNTLLPVHIHPHHPNLMHQRTYYVIGQH